MSMKRQAVTELNHENWDKEDPEEQEESGTFKTAPIDILEKRVIRTAKRRSTQPQASSDEAKKSVFSGFGGFNKTQPSSFDFLAKLTNGNKNTNNDKSTSNDTPVSNTLFSSKPAMGSPTGIFGNSSAVKTSLASPNTQSTSNLFSSSSNKVVSPSSVFTAIKADSTVKDSPFKIQPVTSTGDKNTDISKIINTNTTSTPTSQVTSNIFGISSTSGTTTIPGKSLFATNNNTSSLFKTQSTNSTAVSNTNSNNTKKSDDKNDDKKITYYTKLKGLNESVSDWIKKHVEETPLCILTPIFKDYEKYLKEMQDEYEAPEKENSKNMSENKGGSQNMATAKTNTIPASSNSTLSTTNLPSSKPSIFGNTNNTTTVGDKPTGFTFGANSSSSVTSSTSAGFTFGNNTSTTVKTTASTGFSFGSNVSSTGTPASTGFTFGNKTSTAITTTTSTGFSFGNKTSAAITTTASTGFTFGSTTSTAATTTASTGFTFGNNTSAGITSTTSTGFAFGVTSTSTSATTASTPFSFTPSKTTNTNGAAPFSFGTGKPFSFNSNVTQKVENAEGNNDAQEEEDTPPKVEFTPIAEENSVYDKRCKIFIKKDGNFVDKGVGTLYIKKIEDSDKHQLLVRANTTLGNVLLNLRLATAIPTQRMGKNNVMLVCIPTPETKPPPTPVLIRVKTAEEADELLETLNKYKS